MRRRDFIRSTAAAAMVPGVLARGLAQAAEPASSPAACCLTYASPAAAAQSPREELAYVTVTCVGISSQRPDYLATVDLNPQSPSYSKIVHRLNMPKAGDELHHFGWNACSSCHGDSTRSRRYLVLPGLRSNRIQIADVADPRTPRLHKIIDSSAIIASTNLTAPHTVHCLPSGQIMLSMLGDSQGNAPVDSCCWTTSSMLPAVGNIRPARSDSITTSGISPGRM